MTKKQKIEQEIKELELEIKRLRLLLDNVNGDVLEFCPNCKTKNRHWYTSENWCCAFC